MKASSEGGQSPEGAVAPWKEKSVGCKCAKTSLASSILVLSGFIQDTANPVSTITASVSISVLCGAFEHIVPFVSNETVVLEMLICKSKNAHLLAKVSTTIIPSTICYFQYIYIYIQRDSVRTCKN